MQVQIIDSRPPLTVAIALAKQANAPLLSKWQEDMAAMVAEVTRKYFGMLTEEAVRDGLAASIALLSVGLLRASAGANEPEIWLQTLQREGVRGVSKLAVELIKACDALPDYAVVFAPKETLRPSLLLSLFSYASKTNALKAYAYLMRETAQRTEVKRQIDLAEWLLNYTPSGRIARRDMDAAFGFGGDSPDADIVLHRMLSQACGIAKPKPQDESLGEEMDMAALEFPITKLGPKLLAQARQFYDELELKIPEQLRPALRLNNVSWFERFILPTRITKAGKKSPGA